MNDKTQNFENKEYIPKTKEELVQIKQKYEKLTTKLKELSVDELQQVTGGKAVSAYFDFVINIKPEESTDMSKENGRTVGSGRVVTIIE